MIFVVFGRHGHRLSSRLQAGDAYIELTRDNRLRVEGIPHAEPDIRVESISTVGAVVALFVQQYSGTTVLQALPSSGTIESRDDASSVTIWPPEQWPAIKVR